MYTLAYHSEHYSITRVFKEKTSAPHYVITGSQPVHNHNLKSNVLLGSTRYKGGINRNKWLNREGEYMLSLRLYFNNAPHPSLKLG